MAEDRITDRASLQLWGGVECTVNRVGERFYCQFEQSGHIRRGDDLSRLAGLGIRTIRYPVLWEKVAPNGLASADWAWTDERLSTLRQIGLTPIVGLLHHGSGPSDTNLLDEAFADRLGEFAGATAIRYPWVDAWTPINEPLTTARFSALYGLWYPHARDDRSFVRALLNQCRGTIVCMAAIRRVNPAARLIQTDDLGRTSGTEQLAETVAFYNERRWLGWDLICGKVVTDHPLYGYLTQNGATARELHAFVERPCPPDIVGVNYYVTSDRWIDHRTERYRGRPHGGGAMPFVDIEAVRVLAEPSPSVDLLLQEAWQRYRLPLAVTEAHIDATREDQLRWLSDIWHGAHAARASGADVRAVTAWSLLGAFDWNSLLCEHDGYYEPGAFDVRAPVPRATALAALIRELAADQSPSHPVLQGEGWWRRPDRFVAEPVASPTVVTPLARHRLRASGKNAAPILISGARGTLGQAFATACRRRNLRFELLDRASLDIADDRAVGRALAEHRPWAVVNASGYVRIDAAENDWERCWRDNTLGPAVLATRCAAAGIGLLTFSSDQVFDGEGAGLRLESSATSPLNVYGCSKQAAEKLVLDRHPAAMVVRTSAFFGPTDQHNFLFQALDALRRRQPYLAACDVHVSPTYLPDLVEICLDLLIDREKGLWHLANRGEVTWAEFAARAALCAGIDAATLISGPAAAMGWTAVRPLYAALGSERASVMPTLDSALARFTAASAARQDSSRVASARSA